MKPSKEDLKQHKRYHDFNEVSTKNNFIERVYEKIKNENAIKGD